VGTFVGRFAGQHRFQQTKKHMLWTICVILIILWLLGLVTGSTIGGLIHILLVIAIIMVLANFISGRKRL
jgi:fucose permease